MTIPSNALAQFFQAGTVQSLGTTAGTTASAAFTPAFGTNVDVSTVNVPYATFVLSYTMAAAAAAGEAISLHLRALNIEGSNHEPVPSADYAGAKVGEFKVESNVTAIRYALLVVELHPRMIKNQQTFEAYLENGTANTFNAGAELFYDLKTYGPAP